MARSGLSVLIVDDDTELVSLLSEVLSGMGYSVTGSDNPLEAASILENSKESIDILISDYHMDEMRGDQLGKLALREAPDMKFVLMSSDPSAARCVLQDDLFLEKPFSISELRDFMGRVDSVSRPGPIRGSEQAGDRRSAVARSRSKIQLRPGRLKPAVPSRLPRIAKTATIARH